MENITMKIEMSEEVEQKINETVQTAVTAALAEISGDLTRLNTLVGQIEGDVNVMVGRMVEARTIVKSLNAKIAEMTPAPAPVEVAKETISSVRTG